VRVKLQSGQRVPIEVLLPQHDSEMQFDFGGNHLQSFVHDAGCMPGVSHFLRGEPAVRAISSSRLQHDLRAKPTAVPGPGVSGVRPIL
jgi:hypothetical protein